ncbi:FeoA domain-containing protein, partial [Faecalibacterium prausnitzii]|uniref:FeoA domain-containing protein n=1 Tax=Faecalibacterium prausnitzii TaxID=853 RepID=UPI0029668F1F
MRSLAQLERDEKCRVERLLLAGDMKRRLMDLGFTKEKKITRTIKHTTLARR